MYRIIGLLDENGTRTMQLELQREHLGACGLPWASVLKLDHLDHGKCGVLRRYYWYRDGEDGV